MRRHGLHRRAGRSSSRRCGQGRPPHGIAHAAAVLDHIDDYYSDQHDGAGRGVASQVIRQLADPRPADTATIKDLARYKGLAPRWHRWSDVVAVCRLLAAAMTTGGG